MCDADNRSALASRVLEVVRRLLLVCAAGVESFVLLPVPVWADHPLEQAPRVLTGHQGEVFAVAFSPDGQLVASAGADQAVHVWERGTGRAIKTLRGHAGPIRALAFSPDSRRLVSGSADTTLRFWDVMNGRELQTARTSFGSIRAIAFAPDGKTIATGGDDSTLRLWDAASAKEVKSARGTFGLVYALEFSPDGRVVASGASDGKVHLYDGATWLQRSAFSGHQGAVHAVTFSPTGTWLASGGADGEIRLWDAENGQEHLTLSGHRGDVYAVVFSADGRTLVSGGADGTVRVWDVATGHERHQLSGHKGPVWSLALSRDGTQVLTGGRDRFVRLQPSTPLAFSTSLAEKMKQKGDEVGAPPSPPPLPEADLSMSPPEVKAGGALTITVAVVNKGKGPLYRLQARTKSADPLFNGHLFYFGKVDAGEVGKDAVTIHIPNDRPDGEAPFDVVFEEYNGFVPAPSQAAVALKGLPRPRFAYTYQVLDDGSGKSVGNGDGRVQTGEAVDVLLTVKNVGTVVAQNTTIDLAVPPTPGLKLDHMHVTLGPLKPDEAKQQRVNLFVPRDQREPQIPLRLFIREKGTNVMLEETVALAVDHQAAPQVTVLNKVVTVTESSVKLHSGAGADTSVLASASKGQALAVTGQLGEWYRVQISETERGWIAKQVVADMQEPVKGDMPIPAVTGAPVVKLFQNAPPVIALASPADGAQVSTDRVQLVGAAASEKGIVRVEIQVNGQPVVKREGRAVTTVPDDKLGEANFEFTERVLLQEGQNEIVVAAVDHNNQRATRTIHVTRASDRGKIWAVVIGISKYKSVHPLRFADRDAAAFHEYLVKQVGVPVDNTMLLLNEQATLTNLKRTLGTELKRKAGEKDTVIIYYAGHGAPEADASSGDDDGLEKYIVPYDADPKDLYTTGLPMREVETIFHRLTPERVVFINDSCYSGATAGRTFATASRRAVVSETFLNRLSSGKGRVVLTASKASEVSEERDDLGHGVFTYYLLEGLRGKADTDGDGIITVDEAYSYVAKKVPEATGQNQHPVKKGEVEGQLVLGQVSK